MDPAIRESVVWGVVGGLSFLVLTQGYELATGEGIAATVKVGGAVVVAVLSTVVIYASLRRMGDEEAGA